MSQTVQRATEIMELIATTPRSSDDVARLFELHRTTAFRQLQTLERAGFLVHRADGKYAIGARMIAIAQQALDNLNLRQIAYGDIRALHERVGNSIHLAQLLEDRIIYVDTVESRDGVHMYTRIGRSAEPNSTGIGKVILAQLTEQRRSVLLRHTEWRRHTATTHTTRESLDIELEEIRKNGWGVDNGEFEEFVNGIAAPILDSAGAVVGALSIGSITMVHSLDDLRAHIGDLVATTHIISHQLG